MGVGGGRCRVFCAYPSTCAFVATTTNDRCQTVLGSIAAVLISKSLGQFERKEREREKGGGDREKEGVRRDRERE